jgi:arsenite/tail-anchored protein-transporting ATPase
MRIILYTGKGGVGKTSVAAATAVRAAKLGYRTVVMSTDLAHSLSDSLDVKLGPEPTLVAPNLWAQETDIYYNLRTYWGRIQEWLTALLAWRNVDQIVADEVSVLPGMEELANLLWVNRHRESGNYDAIVVDCAPTGETFRLLSFPEVGRWWIEKLLPIHRAAARVARPFITGMTGMPMPEDDVYEAVKDLFGQLDRLHGMLVQPDLTSLRLVMNPERMVIQESQRTLTYINLFGYPADMVVCNRVLPETVKDAYFAEWHAQQAGYLQMIEERFAPLPIVKAPLFQHEIVGQARLEELATALFADGDPTLQFYRGPRPRIERDGDDYVLRMPLPFAHKGDVDLTQVGDELIVQVGPHKRQVELPRTLAGMRANGARFEGDALVVRFVADARSPVGSPTAGRRR